MKLEHSFIERFLPWLVLVGLFTYTVGFFVRAPYAGFVYDRNGIVLKVFQPGTYGELRVGDRLEKVNFVDWYSFQQNRTQPLFTKVHQGQIVTLHVLRQDQSLTIDWQFPGFTWPELQERLNSEWWLGYIFWFAGVATMRLVRPKKLIWKLLTGFHFLTALWLVTGSVSAFHIWYSVFVFHAAIWLCIPLYWQLHFTYPQPLFSIPKWSFPALYLLAFVFLGLDWISWLPENTFETGSLTMLIVSIILLGLHLVRPVQRQETKWLLVALLLSFLPAIIMVFATRFGFPLAFQGGLLLGIVAIPGIYFLAAYQTQLDSLHNRIHRLIKIYVILISILTSLNILLSLSVNWVRRIDLTLGWGTVTIILSATLAILGLIPIFSLPALSGAYHRTESLSNRQLELVANRYFTPFLFASLLIPLALVFWALSLLLFAWTGDLLLGNVISWIFAALITLTSYPYFKTVVERHLFGLPPLPEGITEAYSNRLVALRNRQEIVYLLRDEILPTLQVQESALFYVDQAEHVELIFSKALATNILPSDKSLLKAMRQLQYGNEGSWSLACSWIELVVPLYLQERPVGLWLFGRRDPDNLYSRRELPMFEALAAQTAVALNNFTQAETLQALYKANIERHEQERIWLAHELHDVTLSQLGVLGMYVEGDMSSKFHHIYSDITQHLRQIVAGLRPKMLDYGLWAGLNQLVDDLSDRRNQDSEILFDLPQTPNRYAIHIEQEIYRIVQQAIENALRHAQAEVIRIYGHIDTDNLNIQIEDNGIGFSYQRNVPIAQLLAEKHFGLVGMQERATLIGATLQINSVLNEGTTVSLTWQLPVKRVNE